MFKALRTLGRTKKTIETMKMTIDDDSFTMMMMMLGNCLKLEGSNGGLPSRK